MLPLKQVAAGTISIAEVQSLADDRHRPQIEIVTAILDGSHRAWDPLLRAAKMPTPCGYRPAPSANLSEWRATLRGCRGRAEYAQPTARPSPVTGDHIADLERWGVVAPARRTERVLVSVLFLTPKACGTRSRAVYDARCQNAMIDWCAFSDHGRFRLPGPLQQVMVGTGHGIDGPILGAEVDLRSYFFLFQWAPALGAAHGFRAGTRRYRFAVPVQGSAVMPLVAQSTTLALAEGPLVGDDPGEYVKHRMAVTYDNVLMVDAPDDLRRRLARFCERAAKAGALIGDVQPPTSGTVTSCGLEYHMGRRTWRLKDAWTTKAVTFIDEMGCAPTERQRQILAGYALWAHRATLSHLAPIMPLLYLRQDVRAIEQLRALLVYRTAPPPLRRRRRLLSRPMPSCVTQTHP